MPTTRSDPVHQSANSETGPASPTRWRLATRVGFRFCLVYFGLFCLLFAQITFVFTGVFAPRLPDHAVLWQLIALEPLLSWVGRTVFGVDAQLRLDSGSGDQAVIWVLVFTLLVLATIVTALWSILDRRRPEYTRLHAWFLVFVRLCLGGQMLFYGMAKVIPTQMPAPPPSALLQPYGEFSPASVLWLQVGSSQPYEMLLGSVEVLGGLLLFLPATATLGALISLAGMGQVFLMNMTFDVPVKILSFHLLLLSLVLLAPQLRRLADLLVFGRPSEPVGQPPLFASARANRRATAVQVVLGVWVLLGATLISWDAWRDYGRGSPKPELYGVWTVTEFVRDGVAAPPLTTDDRRWQRLVFDTGAAAAVQKMDGTLQPAQADIDAAARELRLDGAEAGTFSFIRDGADTLQLSGTWADAPVRVRLQRTDPGSFPLLSRGFHWVQEYPYFR